MLLTVRDASVTGEDTRNRRDASGTGVVGYRVLVPVASQPVAKETLGTG